jgi:hypothetical protein
MNENHLVIAIIVISVLLMITLIFFIAREIILKNTKGIVFPEPEPEPEPEIQSAVDVLANKPKSETETQKEHELEPPTKEPLYSAEDDIVLIDEHDIVLTEESQTNETVSLTPTSTYENLPQDSMLRRHVITHVHAMVESKMPLRPTDSALRRHYDTMINHELNRLQGNKVV